MGEKQLMTRRFTAAFVLAALPFVSPAVAETVGAADKAAASDQAAAQPSVSQPLAVAARPAANPGSQFKATPVLPIAEPVAASAQDLLNRGILLRGTFNNDFQGNPIGGLQQGTANGGTATFGADFHLGRLVGIEGGQIHFLLANTYGTTMQSYIGNYIKSQGWYYPYQRFELAQMAYEQDLFDGRVNIYAGRTNATAFFARSTYGCYFVSGSQCPQYLTLFGGGFSGFPYATWGGRVLVKPMDRIYVESGVFSVDPNRRNVSGFDLGLQTVTGMVVPFEIGYQTDFSNDEYPRHFKLGGWYNDAPSVDPLLNTRHLSRALSAGAPLMNTFSRAGIYGQADQVIYRPDNSKRNLAIFATVAAPFDEREVLAQQSTIGAVFTGPFDSRPRDTVGLMLTYITFTPAETLYMNQLLKKNGSTTFVSPNQLNIEANYNIRVFPGFSLTPNIEYIINPDTTQRPNARFAPQDALIIGVRATFNLGDFLGLPSALPGSTRG